MINFPANPNPGDIFTDSGYSWRWNGAKWVVVGAGGSVVTISDTPPTNPNVGAFWYDSVGAQLYIYYDDGNSSQWVVAVNPSSSGGGAEGISYLPLTGGILTGNLTVQGVAESRGVTDGSQALPGYVGEMQLASLNTPNWGTGGGWSTACSLALTPGDWEINGAIRIVGAITGISMGVAIATTPIPPNNPYLNFSGGIFQNLNISCPPLRTSSAAPVTAYLLAALAATVSINVTGFIWAQRRR